MLQKHITTSKKEPKTKNLSKKKNHKDHKMWERL